MPTHYEAALMSHFAYQYPDARIRLNDIRHLRYQSEFFTDTRDYDVNDLRVLFCNSYDPSNLDHQAAKYLHEKGWKVFYASNFSTLIHHDPNAIITDYFGIAFINTRDAVREIVIAHRGTLKSSSSNIQDDVEILKAQAGHSPKILKAALSFVVNVIQRRDSISAIHTYRLTQTGHSLGGFLAEFGAAYVANPENLPHTILAEGAARLHASLPDCAFAITFDSLGSQTLLLRFGIPSNGTRTINYLLQPNIANTANRHDGERRQLLKTIPGVLGAEHQSGAFTATVFPLPTDIMRMTQIQQEIDNIVNLFVSEQNHLLVNFLTDCFDAQTGEPILYWVVCDWPVATNTFTIRTPDAIIPNFHQNKDLRFGLYRIAVVAALLLANQPIPFDSQDAAITVSLHHRREGLVRYSTDIAHAPTSIISPILSSSSVPMPAIDVLESMTEAHSVPAMIDSSGPLSASTSVTQQPVSQQSMFALTASSSTSSSQPAEEMVVSRTGYRPRGRTL